MNNKVDVKEQVKKIIKDIKNTTFDKRMRYYAIIDIESIGVSEPRIYDVGIAITNKKEVVYKASLVVNEVFNSRLWDSAYYKDKRSLYIESLKNGISVSLPFWEIKKIVNEILKHFRVSHIGGYNFSFDMRAFDFSKEVYKFMKGQTFIENSHRYIFFDIWSLATRKEMSSKEYIDFCLENGFFTEKGNPLTNAEKCYAFLTSNPNFAEEHTGMEDSVIESEIFRTLLKKDKRLLSSWSYGKDGNRWVVEGSPWRIVSNYFKEKFPTVYSNLIEKKE